MSGFAILDSGLFAENESQHWLTIRASPALSVVIGDFVVERNRRVMTTLYDEIRVRMKQEFDVDMDTKLSHVALVYHTFPPIALVSRSVLGGRLLRIAKSANGHELRDAIHIFHQLVVHDSLRLSLDFRRDVVKCITDWGNGVATEDDIGAIHAVILAITKEHDNNVNAITIDASTTPSEKLMLDYKVASRRSVMDSLLEGICDLRIHEIILLLQYLQTYAVVEVLESATHTSRLSIADDWDNHPCKARSKRVAAKSGRVDRRVVSGDIHASDESISLDLDNFDSIPDAARHAGRNISISSVDAMDGTQNLFDVQVVDDVVKTEVGDIVDLKRDGTYNNNAFKTTRDVKGVVVSMTNDGGARVVVVDLIHRGIDVDVTVGRLRLTPGDDGEFCCLVVQDVGPIEAHSILYTLTTQINM